MAKSPVPLPSRDSSTSLGMTRETRSGVSLLRMRRGRLRGNRILPNNVRSPDYQSDRRSKGADLLRIRPRRSQNCNLRCRNLVRQSLVLLARLRTLLRPLCAVFSTKDTKLKRKVRFAAAVADVRLAISYTLSVKCLVVHDLVTSTELGV